MIKFVHNSIAYYYLEKRHYDQAVEPNLLGELSAFQLMAMAHFAVCQITNQLLKNRYASLEHLLDDHFTPEVAN